MAGTRKSAWKICSRGHKFRASRCPYCWKRNQTHNPKSAGGKSKTARRKG